MRTERAHVWTCVLVFWSDLEHNSSNQNISKPTKYNQPNKKKKGQTAISARAPTVARISMRSCFFTMCGIKYRAPRWRYRRNIVLFFQPKTIYGWIFGAHAVLAHDLRCDGRRDVRACVRSVPPPQAHRCVINLCAVSIHKRARAFIHERRVGRSTATATAIVFVHRNWPAGRNWSSSSTTKTMQAASAAKLERRTSDRHADRPDRVASQFVGTGSIAKVVIICGNIV